MDSRYYEWKPIRFTISELLNGDYVEGVNFDRIAEIINVSTASYKYPKEFNIRVVFTPEENEDAIYSHKGQITIRYNGQMVFLDKDFMFTLKGEEYGLMNRLDLFKITVPESLEIEFEAMQHSTRRKMNCNGKLRKKRSKNQQIVIVL